MIFCFFFFYFCFIFFFFFFFFQAEDGIRDKLVTGVQTCALPILEDVEQVVPLEAVLEKADHARVLADRRDVEIWFAVEAGVVARPLHRHRLRSEEHTSELQSLAYLVCRLLLEKKKKKKKKKNNTKKNNNNKTIITKTYTHDHHLTVNNAITHHNEPQCISSTTY